MTADDSLLESLPVRRRLALAYAPADVRLRWLSLFALDARLAAIVRQAREPMLAQIKLAWWREAVLAMDGQQASGTALAEPLLQVLASWQGHTAGLIALVDGWERLVAPAPLPVAELAQFAGLRGQAYAVLAGDGAAGEGEAGRLAVNWALADLALHLSQGAEREAALALAQARDWRGVALAAHGRPLLVLHGLAWRALRRGRKADRVSPMDMLVAMRLGLFGR